MVASSFPRCSTHVDRPARSARPGAAHRRRTARFVWHLVAAGRSAEKPGGIEGVVTPRYLRVRLGRNRGPQDSEFGLTRTKPREALMKHLSGRLLLRTLLAGLLLLAVEVQGQTPVEWRPMFLPLQTTTASDEQFLTGAVRDGRPTLLAGELRVPARAAAPVPALVMLHGSNGISRAHHQAWADFFNGLGIATFLIDSFAGRGIDGTVNDQSQLGQLAMVYDAYRGLEMLAKDPRIDAARIGLFGSSRGAVASLYASMTRFQRMYLTSGASFAVYLSFYPVCNRTYIDDISVAQRPIRIFHGTADNVAPISRCRTYVRRLREAGHDVVLTEYSGAYHGFDSPIYPP